MAPPFWIHCNLCGALLSSDNKHFLLSCSHIACKDCLKQTAGKKCPACKADVRYEDMSKLPEKLKNNFHPNIQNLFQEPSKIIDFQQSHARDIARKTRDYKTKYSQALSIYEKEKVEVMKMKKQLDGYVHQRKLMQEKLKEVYLRNKMKKQHEIYRNPANVTLSSDFSTEKARSSLRTSGTSQSRSNFFNQSSPIVQGFNSRSNDFFDSHPSTPRKKKLDHTQSSRKPFYS
ncbi:unnamed protein product [Chironomus riparius]|uniref:RING-type domain-containing protein n=1 Tax=Chironomus riparius TaxID=315576 RepID=A0A9N9WQ91_9DIPT|nr:unnamed protein product [Chironomus riparius]